ncbi:MAG TPA: hypothetical protein VHG91_16585 [Longimicrobium sp.]|nr:hypothetical protein [Longimicrobium sp.]
MSPIEKIKDADLRRMASEGTSGPIGVLIELDLPAPRVGRVEPGASFASSWAVGAADGDDEGERLRRVTQARDFLAPLVGSDPRWLQASGAFSARVSPSHLAAIAECPLIRAIWANRGGA